MLKEGMCVKENQSNTEVKAVKVDFIGKKICNRGKACSVFEWFKSETAGTSGNYKEQGMWEKVSVDRKLLRRNLWVKRRFC